MDPQSWGLLKRSAMPASGQAAPCLQKVVRSRQEPPVLPTKLSGGRASLMPKTASLRAPGTASE